MVNATPLTVIPLKPPPHTHTHEHRHNVSNRVLLEGHSVWSAAQNRSVQTPRPSTTSSPEAPRCVCPPQLGGRGQGTSHPEEGGGLVLKICYFTLIFTRVHLLMHHHVLLCAIPHSLTHSHTHTHTGHNMQESVLRGL